MLVLPLYIVLALLVHEAGHALAAALLRLPWKPVLTKHGPGISIGSDDVTMTPQQVRVTCAAGPLVSLALAVAAFKIGLPFLGLVSAELGVLNLLPLKRSDGRRILNGHA